MKKRMIVTILPVLLLVSLLILMSSCSLLGDSSGGTGSNSGKNAVYNVTLHVDSSYGFTVYDFVDKNSFIIKKPSKVPEKEGFVFVRWCSDEDCTKELTYGSKLTSNLHIYAQWTEKLQTVTLVDTIAETNTEISVVYGAKADLPVKIATGYDFDGWFTDIACTDLYDANRVVQSDFTLYSGWTMQVYDIVYVYEDGALSSGAPTKYTMFEDVTLPGCTREGYSFVGWYDNSGYTGNIQTKIEEGSQGEKRYYAKFLCELTEAEGKNSAVTVSSNTLSFGTTYTEKTLDINDYVTFSHGATYRILQDNRDTTLYFEQNDGEDILTFTYTLRVTSEEGSNYHDYVLEIKQYTSNNIAVTYYNNGDVYATDPSIVPGMQAQRQTAPTPEPGYVFLYWSLTENGEEFDFNTLLVENTEFYAVYEAIVYSFYYHLGAGMNAVANPATFTVTDAVVFEDALPALEGYTFAGWYTDETYSETITGISVGTTEDVTVYAAYTLETLPIKDFSGREEISLAELNDYFVYMVYNRITRCNLRITGGREGETIGSYLVAANNAVSVDGGEGRKMIYYSELTADENGVWDMSEYGVSMTYKGIPTLASDFAGYPQVEPAELHLSKIGRAKDFNDFAIEHVTTTVSVIDSEQLVYAVEHGYRPIPVEGSTAEELYNTAKGVLRTWVDDGMTNYEKALAIYEYITRYCSYDHAIYDSYTQKTITSEEAGRYFCFYLEGVLFHRVAVCDGYSKAFMLLCRMEGIPAVQVEGKSVEEGIGHAWNKVYLVENGEGAWYVVDCTSGDTLVNFAGDEKEILTHAYFLNTDEQMEERYTEETSEFDYEADGEIDYYSRAGFEWDDVSYDYVISSNEEMVAFLRYLMSITTGTKQVSLDIEFTANYDPFLYNTEKEISGIDTAITSSIGIVWNSYSISQTKSSDGRFTFICAKK